MLIKILSAPGRGFDPEPSEIGLLCIAVLILIATIWIVRKMH